MAEPITPAKLRAEQATTIADNSSSSETTPQLTNTLQIAQEVTAKGPVAAAGSMIERAGTEALKPYGDFVQNPSVNRGVDAVASTVNVAVNIGSTILMLDPNAIAAAGIACTTGSAIDGEIAEQKKQNPHAEDYSALRATTNALDDGLSCALVPSKLVAGMGHVGVNLTAGIIKTTAGAVLDPSKIETLPADLGNIALNAAHETGNTAKNTADSLPPFVKNGIYGIGNVAGETLCDVIPSQCPHKNQAKPENDSAAKQPVAKLATFAP